MIERLRSAARACGIPHGDAPPLAEPLEPDPVRLAASGPRVAERRDEVELAVAAVLEGCLLHYGAPRALAIDDPDLALLAGDRLYALGLAELASVGDLEAIAELADIIALSAQAHAAGDPDLALAAWAAGAVAIGHGADPAIARAKERARAGDPAAAGALRATAIRSGH